MIVRRLDEAGLVRAADRTGTTTRAGEKNFVFGTVRVGPDDLGVAHAVVLDDFETHIHSAPFKDPAAETHRDHANAHVRINGVETSDGSVVVPEH